VRREDGLFEPFIDGVRQPGDFPTGPKPVEVVAGALEGSNVNHITAMVKLIDESRSFESSIRFIKSAKEIDETGSQLLRA
ncbi:MAG: flagellar basal body rod C-terminal domain-containing protein, partial [Burkholderiaceae bacterium]